MGPALFIPATVNMGPERCDCEAWVLDDEAAPNEYERGDEEAYKMTNDEDQK